MVHVASDGNCLFRAISYLLFGHEDEHWSLRNLIIRFENLNSSIFEKRMTMINQDTFEEHVKKLCHPNSWATHIEVFAIATYFQVPVYFCVDPPHPSRRVYCWECYMPVLSVENLHYPNVTEPPFNDTLSVKHFEIVYHDNCHYNSIVCADTGSLSTSPPPVTKRVVHEDKIIE